jgi:hypothetical protein
MASFARMIGEGRIVKDVVGINRCLNCVRLPSQNLPEATEENHQTLQSENRDKATGFKRGTSRYESGVPTTRSRRSVP